MQRVFVSMFACVGCAGCAAQPPAMSARALIAQRTTLAAAPAPASPRTPASSEPRRSDAMARAYGWMSVSIGGFAGAVAIGTSFMMLHQKGVRDDNCSSHKLCTQAGIDANSSLSSLAAWNAGAYAVAAVGLGVGAFLVLTNAAGKDKDVAAGVGPGGIRLRGQF